MAKKRKRGRPKHEDPPKVLGTTIPASLLQALRDLSALTGLPQSHHVAEALRRYLARRTPRK